MFQDAISRPKSFATCRRGAAAVEFAFVSLLLIITILFVLSVGLLIFLTQSLDFATSKAARQVMIGSAQKAGIAQSSFASTYVCPYLPAAMTCGNVIVNVQSLTQAAQPGGYYTLVNSSQTGLIVPPLNNAQTQFSLGTQASYEYLEVIFPVTFLPNAITSLLSGGATYNGSPAILIISTAAFRNEKY